MYDYKDLINSKISGSSQYKKISVAILSDNSIEFLVKCIRGYGIKNLIDFSIWNSPINQIENQSLSPLSEYNNSSFDYTIVFESSHVLLKKFNLTHEKKSFFKIEFERIKKIIRSLKKTSRTKVIIFNFYELNDKVYGNYSSKTESSFIFQLRKLNILISEFCVSENRLSILDISSIQNIVGSNRMFNSAQFDNYGMVLTLDILPIITKNIMDIILSHESIIKKCLILDLDNTLWGGIIGDDGIEKIQLGDLGTGKSFVEFQHWIKKLKDRGVILCVCSKNEEKTAKNVFLNHPDMVLSLEDISVFVSNWNPKNENIKRIQKVLNISYDSMVFVDDSPFERNLVKTSIPQISVPDLPKDPSNYLSFMYEQNFFETVSISTLDKNRTKLYQEEFIRSQSKDKYDNLSDYMSSLKMKSKLELLNSFNIPRVSQLSQRSNQFNLRTIRYLDDDLIKIMESNNKYGLVFELSDKFGNYGIISFVILEIISSDVAFIENWAMSCRVFQRGVENYILNQIVEFLKSKSVTKLYGEFNPSPKNMVVKNLFPKLLFKKTEEFKYVLDLKKHLPFKTFINTKNK